MKRRRFYIFLTVSLVLFALLMIATLREARAQAPYFVTFTQTGISGDAGSNTVLTLGGTNYPMNNLPTDFEIDSEDTTFTWASAVAGFSGERFVYAGDIGLTSPITANGTDAATYTTQYQVSFTQNGISGDAGSNTVLTLNGISYAYNALPSGVWVDNGTTFAWSSTVAGFSGERFVYAGDSGLTSPITASGTDAATYTTQYQVTITSSPATGSGYVTVDGGAVTTPYTTPWWDSGSPHTIAANSPVSLVSGQSQYIYSSWSDSGAQSHSISPTTVTTYTATFQLQYNFSVSSAYDSPTGEGWYNAGSSISSSVTRPFSGGTGIQYETTGWTGTGSLSSGGSTGSSSTGSFTLNAYTTCTWNWKTQCYLTVSSAYDSPFPVSGWFDSGSDFSESVTSPTAGPSGTRYICTGWSGTGSVPPSGTSSSVTFTISAPSSVTWNWKTQYQVTFSQSGVGSDFTGTVITIEGSNYGVSSLPVSFWWNASSGYSFSFASPLLVGSKQYVWGSTSGLSSLQSGTLTVTASGNVVGNYQVQNQVTFDEVGVSSDFTGTVVVIDTVSYTRSQLPVSFSWSLGSGHSFAFQSPLVVGATTEQYVWTNTTGLTSAQSGMTIIESYGSIVGYYKTQYYLNVSSAHDSPSPLSGWFDLGSGITESVTSPVTAGSGTQYVCIGWTGTGSVPFSGNSSSTTFTITGASSITWNWQVGQCWLNVYSAHDTPNPANGVDSFNGGSNVTASVSSPVTENGILWSCTGWTGTGSVPASGAKTSVTFTISQNSSITWNWHSSTAQQYTLTIASAHGIPSPAVGYHPYDANDSITCSVVTPVTESGITYVCTGWSGSGSVPPSGTNSSLTFTINQNSTIIWNWQVAQWTLTVSSAYGNPSPSVGDNTFNDGSSVVCNVSSPVTEGGVSYTCTGWTGTGSVPSSGSDTSTTFTITENSTITWNWIPTPTVQWNLTVASAHDSPNPSVGDHLYGDGYSVTCNVSSPVNESGVVWTCTGWSGTGSVPSSGTTESVTFTISQNSTITWNWHSSAVQQYTLTIASAHGSPSPAVGDRLYDDNNSVTCSVVTPVTESGVTYVCTGWNGTGSVPPSGSATSVTFTITENSTITWNWQIQAPAKPTVESCDSTGAKQDVFSSTETVYITGAGYPENQTFNLYIVNATTWVDGAAIPDRIQGTATSVSSTPSGNISITMVLNESLVSGNYDVLVDVNGTGKYNAQFDPLYSFQIVSPTESPEYIFGTILGLTGCFAALGVFRVYKRKHQ